MKLASAYKRARRVSFGALFLHMLYENLSRLYREVNRFLLTGGVATLAHIGTLTLLSETSDLPFLAATAIASTPAFFIKLHIYRHFVFNAGNGSLKKQFGWFFLKFIGGSGLNWVLTFLLIEWAQLWYLWAQLCITTILAVTNFLLARIIFRAT